jgi:hypothetical protein
VRNDSIRLCEVCDKPLKRTQKRFCSHECYRITTTVHIGTVKVCRECKQEYAATASTKKYNWCLSCRSAYYRAYNKRIANASRIRNLKKYGLTIEDYGRLLELQGGVCAICGVNGGKRLAVDHCHDTGNVRGLLCFDCNVGLGKFQDNADLLRRALAHLERSYHRNHGY